MLWLTKWHVRLCHCDMCVCWGLGSVFIYARAKPGIRCLNKLWRLSGARYDKHEGVCKAGNSDICVVRTESKLPMGNPTGMRKLFLVIARRTCHLRATHHSIYLWFICFPWWSSDELENLHADRTTVCFEPWQKLRAKLGSRKTGLSPALF